MTQRRDYFTWLCRQVYTAGHGRDDYSDLLELLHQTEFYSLCKEDDNCAYYGQRLREEFMDSRTRLDTCLISGAPCTLLELLVSLAREMDYVVSEVSDEHYVRAYFWILLKNLGLEKCTNDWLCGSSYREDYVMDTLDKFMEREYEADGNGGLFPLRRPGTDQTQIGIWFQMHAWLYENPMKPRTED